MRHNSLSAMCMLACALAVAFASGPAAADKPSWAGEGAKGRGDEPGEDREAHREHGPDHEHFRDRHRAAVSEYYAHEFRFGRCPPGLAKKHDGCMPPGQARRWEIGRPLPPDVVYYDVPPTLVVQLGVPPRGYKYVRVAGDILLIAAGTAIVADAIRDLGR